MWSLSRPAAVNGTLYSRRYSQASRPVYPEAPYTTTAFVLIRFVLRVLLYVPVGALGCGRPIPGLRPSGLQRIGRRRRGHCAGRLLARLHTHAAVDRQSDAGDEASRVGGKEDNRVGHLGLFAQSA